MHVCHDGYTYHLNKVKGDVRYLVCTFSKTLDCKATGKIEGQFTTIKGVHNHPVPTGKNDTIIIEKALMEASIKERGNLKNIYERVAVRGYVHDSRYNELPKAFPLIHLFMESRTKSLYDKVFAYIHQNFTNFLNGNIVTDYEVALVESLRNNFPNAMLHGCFLHYCQQSYGRLNN